ncbi:Ig-like domain-containing protein [Sphingomonas aerolata]|uniref:Ig-like domain-containing protein n=1 Tax=Sphingomonas aerolata TaxID=185951 RepID=UPI002FE10458
MTPAVAVNGDGTLLSGTGEPGAIVTVTDVNGVVIGTATAGTDGAFAVPAVAGADQWRDAGRQPGGCGGQCLARGRGRCADLTAPAAPTIALDGTGTIRDRHGRAGCDRHHHRRGRRCARKRKRQHRRTLRNHAAVGADR